MYSEVIMTEALHNKTAEVVINGIPINNIRHADDTVLLVESISHLQRLFQKIYDSKNHLNMTIIRQNF